MSELWQHTFFRHAVLACVLGGGGLSLIGVFVTLMDIPFLGISMSHSAFLGAVIGLLCGFDPLAGAMIACAISGLLVGPIADRAGSSSNSVLAVIFSATMGLAFLLLARIPGPKSEALNLIWGSILTISGREIVILAVIFSVTVLLLVVFFTCEYRVLGHCGVDFPQQFLNFFPLSQGQGSFLPILGTLGVGVGVWLLSSSAGSHPKSSSSIV